jgi:hypothetical protein
MLHLRLRNVRHPAAFALLLGVAGCAGLNDPFQRAGTWRPEYNNDSNLGAMVADPRHIVQGVGDPDSPGELSAAAIRRLMTDKVKPLPSTDVANVISSGQQQQQSGGSGGNGGTQ